MTTVYLAHAVTNAESTVEDVGDLVKWLQQKQIDVIQPSPAAFTSQLAINTLQKIDDADFVIADVSAYSHGVGFELGYAYALRKEIMVVVQRSRFDRVSAFIAAVFPSIASYANASELIEAVAHRLEAIEGHSPKRVEGGRQPAV